jgi:DNA sulfur modification protein DndD
MKLISVKLKNFRPFINEELIFSTDPEKNITLIKGDNGKGKSTLIKSIVWSLFQINLFKDPKGKEELLINSIVRTERLEIGKDTNVEVVTKLEHEGKVYEFKTFQTWLLDINAKAILNKETQTILYLTDKNGKTTTIYQTSNSSPKNEIEKILRSDLIPYFFVDGENSTIYELTNKSNLKEAITRIMGLETEEKIVQALKPENSNDSIYNRINKRLVSDNTPQINSLKYRIQDLLEKNESDNNKVEIFQQEIFDLNNIVDKNNKILEQLNEVRAKQLQKKNLEIECRDLETKLVNDDKTLFDSFMKNFFFQDKILHSIIKEKNILNTIQNLANKFNKEKALSHISVEAIDQIVQKGICVCGTKIKNNKEALNHLEEIKDYIAPRNFGKGLLDIVNTFNLIISYVDQIHSIINFLISNITKIVDKIDDNIDQIKEIEKEISGHPDASVVQTIVQKAKQDIDFKNRQINSLNESIIKRKVEVDDLELEIRRLTPQTKDNYLNLLKLDYIRNLQYLAINNINQKTTDIIELLNNETNDIFSQMYFKDQRSILIKDDYTIVTTSKNGALIGSANAGALAVANFAFISALIKSAKQFALRDNNAYGVDSDAAYPLLMDAPFATLGSELMQGVARNIHKVCDQMVLFVKPNDYAQVKDELSSKIGKMYVLEFNKESIQDCLIKEKKNV